MPVGYLSVAECAKAKGVHPQAVTAAIRTGRLSAEKLSGVWVIRAEDCAAYAPVKDATERGKRGGRPKRPREEEGGEG